MTTIRILVVASLTNLLAIGPGLAQSDDWSINRNELTQYINRTLNRAMLDNATGRLLDALRGWQVLAALEPGNRMFAVRLQETRAELRRRVDALFSDAAYLAENGKHDQAIERLIDAVELDPYDADIVRRLREIEGQRVEQQLATPARRVFR